MGHEMNPQRIKPDSNHDQMTEGLGGTWAATMGGEVGLSLTNMGFK